MASATINYNGLNATVQNAVNGLVARIIDEETKAAQERLQGRITAETRSLVAHVVLTPQSHMSRAEVNVVISFPDAKA